MSFRAIKSATVGDDKQWITFWVAYSAVEAAETLLEVTYLTNMIPYYYELKLVGIILLLGGGAGKVYDLVLDPLFSIIENKIPEDDLKLLESDPGKFIQNYGAKAYEISKEKMKETLNKSE